MSSTYESTTDPEEIHVTSYEESSLYANEGVYGACTGTE